VRQYLLDLYEIQKIDLSIRDQEKRQEAIPSRLRELETAVEALRKQIAQLAEQRATVQRDIKAQVSLVESEKDKIRKWEARLNDIRNQREYQALQRETEGSKRANRDAEEKISELHKAKDELDKQLEALEIKLVDEETACDDERKKVEAELSALQTQLKEEQARRDSLVPKVPKAMFRKYDAIRGKRFGMGLAAVAQGNCTGCNMRLPPQLYNILQRGDTVEQCPSCHRLIFWDQILPPTEGSAAEAAGAAP
jgi:predicted  nucleic acid-binding Zn-ribbon protein